MNRHITSLAACLAVLALALFSLGGAVQAQQDTIKIGFIGPLSGVQAYVGKSSVQGALLAIEEANAAGGLLGGRRVEFIQMDDRALPAEAVAVAQRLIHDHNVVAIVGPFNSATTMAVKDVASRTGTVIASTGAAADSLTEKDYDWYFRPHMYNQLQSVQLARYIVETLGHKRIAILFENNDWGRGLDTALGELLVDMGAQLVARESFNSGTTDFMSPLLKLRQSNPDAYMVIALITEASIIARQAAEVGIRGDRIIGLGAFDQEKLVELAGKQNVQGIKFMMWFHPDHPDIPEARRFYDAYVARFGEIPDSFAAQGFTAAKAILTAIEDAGTTDRTAVRDAMRKVSFHSPIGHITFGPDHNARTAIFMAQWDNGEKVLLPVQPSYE